MGFLDLTVTIQTEIAQKNDIEAQMIKNNMEKALKSRESTSKTNEINAQFTAESSLIKKDMANEDDKTSKEYELLMQDYKDLQAARDAALTQVENESTDYETQLTIETDALQTRLEAINADLESFKDARDKDIEDSAGYFQ